MSNIAPDKVIFFFFFFFQPKNIFLHKKYVVVLITSASYFCGEVRKYYADTHSYLELCRITRKSHLGQAKAGLNSGVVLFSSGLNPCPAEPGYALPLQTV